MDTTIESISALEILNSRAPEVEVEVMLADGTWGRAAVPSGASTGVHEALELVRDGGNKHFGSKLRRKPLPMSIVKLQGSLRLGRGRTESHRRRIN